MASGPGLHQPALVRRDGQLDAVAGVQLASRWLTWVFVVERLIDSSAEISALVRPRATATSSSVSRYAAAWVVVAVALLVLDRDRWWPPSPATAGVRELAGATPRPRP